jgi:hypothetical protein
MSQTKTACLLLLTFFAECAASRLIVPPARAGTNPQRWEYTCMSGGEDFPRRANVFGEQGWEMAATVSLVAGGTSSGETWCFKRPLP